MAATRYDRTATPTAVGQRIRFLGYGGDVRAWMSSMHGTVARFTANGFPVIALDDCSSLRAQTGRSEYMVTDRHDCARLIDDDGAWVQPQVFSP